MFAVSTYRREGYWFAVVSPGHSLSGTKSMALTKRRAVRNLREALANISDLPDETSGPRLPDIAVIGALVAAFGASAA